MTTYLERENVYLTATGIGTAVEELGELGDAHTKALLRGIGGRGGRTPRSLDLGERIAATTVDGLRGPQPRAPRTRRRCFTVDHGARPVIAKPDAPRCNSIA